MWHCRAQEKPLNDCVFKSLVSSPPPPFLPTSHSSCSLRVYNTLFRASEKSSPTHPRAASPYTSRHSRDSSKPLSLSSYLPTCTSTTRNRILYTVPIFQKVGVGGFLQMSCLLASGEGGEGGLSPNVVLYKPCIDICIRLWTLSAFKF